MRDHGCFLIGQRCECGEAVLGRRIEKAAHVGDLLSLLDDDRLREALELFVARTQLHERHIDGALMMRDHHPDEVAVDIAARRDLHPSCMRAFTFAISE